MQDVEKVDDYTVGRTFNSQISACPHLFHYLLVFCTAPRRRFHQSSIGTGASHLGYAEVGGRFSRARLLENGCGWVHPLPDQIIYVRWRGCSRRRHPVGQVDGVTSHVSDWKLKDLPAMQALTADRRPVVLHAVDLTRGRMCGRNALKMCQTGRSSSLGITGRTAGDRRPHRTRPPEYCKPPPKYDPEGARATAEATRMASGYPATKNT
jgi:hypothetical protein